MGSKKAAEKHSQQDLAQRSKIARRLRNGGRRRWETLAREHWPRRGSGIAHAAAGGVSQPRQQPKPTGIYVTRAPRAKGTSPPGQFPPLRPAQDSKAPGQPSSGPPLPHTPAQAQGGILVLLLLLLLCSIFMH